jgi:hypothetical protein
MAARPAPAPTAMPLQVGIGMRAATRLLAGRPMLVIPKASRSATKDRGVGAGHHSRPLTAATGAVTPAAGQVDPQHIAVVLTDPQGAPADR